MSSVDPIISDKLIPIITDVGKQAIFKKDLDGIKIQISHIALGSGRYTPSTTQTTLEAEELREVFLSSEVDKENYQITLNSIFRDKSKEFWVTEVGFFLEDGTLFAVWSHAEIALSYKSKFSEPLFALNLKLVDVNIDAIEIIDLGIDLTLNFTKEFLQIGNSIVRLSATLYSMSEKLRAALDEFDARAKVQLDKMKLTHSEFKETKEEFSKARKKIQEMSIAQASAITSLQAKQIEEKLRTLTQLSVKEIEEILESLQKEDKNLSKKIKKQRDDLLLPILANANGLLSIQKILVDKKLN